MQMLMPTAKAPPAHQFTAPGLRVLRENANCCVAAYDNLLIILWRRAPDAEAWYEAHDLGAQLARTLGAKKISVMSVLPPRMLGVSASARSGLVDLHRRSQTAVHRAAVVLPDTGLIAAVARSILHTATQRSARRNAHAMFHSLGAAMAWATDGLETTSGRPVPVADLVGDLERSR